jgi:hypothetical protein
MGCGFYNRCRITKLLKSLNISEKNFKINEKNVHTCSCTDFLRRVDVDTRTTMSEPGTRNETAFLDFAFENVILKQLQCQKFYFVSFYFKFLRGLRRYDLLALRIHFGSDFIRLLLL